MKLSYLIILIVFLPTMALTKTLSDTASTKHVITINARLIGKDSVIIPFDSNYTVVQEACTSIIRYGHYNFKTRLFFGKFKDRKVNDQALILAEGAFSKQGLKEGLFILHYLNGQLEARGSFNEDRYDGPWEFYYPNGHIKAKGSFKKGKYIGPWETYFEDGSPELVFGVTDEVCKIWSAWDIGKIQMVSKGDGYYQSSHSPHWNGKLKNGTPDSTWTCHFVLQDSSTVVEYFKNGEFHRGSAESGSFSRHYTDKSAISLLPPLPELRINHSQYLDINPACNGAVPKNTVIKIFNTTYNYIIIPLNGSHAYKDNN